MKNTYTKAGYLFSNIYWYFIFFCVYRWSIFMPVEGMTPAKSVRLLAIILAESFFIGYIIQRKRRRNSLGIMMNVIIGFGAYTMISYMPYMRSGIIKLLVICLVGCILYGLTFIINRDKKLKPRKYFRKSAPVFIRGCHAFLTVTMFSAMIAPVKDAVMDSELFRSDDTTPVFYSNETIEKNIDKLMQLQEDKWVSLSLDERLDILQTIADIERRYLGIPHELNVVYKDIEETDILGHYLDKTHTITVNTPHLTNDDPFDLLNTICHESYHAYQHRLVEMYNESSEKFKELRVYIDVKDYAEEFANYTSGSEDKLTYFTQTCEEDARDYASSAVYEYKERIYSYINPN